VSSSADEVEPLQLMTSRSALWSVYGPKGPAALLSEPTEDEIYIRTSPAPRTYQVRPMRCPSSLADIPLIRCRAGY
jgi:hypothetical protein